MTAVDPFTNLGFDPTRKFDASLAAEKLGVLLNHWVSSSSGGDAFTTGVHTATAPAPTPTTGAAPTTTTAPDAGGANNAIGIAKDTAHSQEFGGGHPGIDISVPVGTPLVAAMDGKVTIAGNNDPNGYGNYVEITTSDGMQIRYGHLSAIDVKVGDTVKAGQLIGKSGGEAGAAGSGNSTGPHLHFEVDINGQAVDPTAVLAGGGQIIKGTATSNPAVQAAASPTPTTGSASYTSPVGTDPFLAGVNTQTAATGTAGTPTTPGGASTVSGATTGADSDPNAVDAFLNAIKQHESNGDYTARNGSGKSNAAGAYQFIGTTWRGLGGSTDSAADASPAEQDAIARAYAIQLFNQYHSWRLAAIAWYQPSAADAVARGEDPGAPEGQGRFIDYGDEIMRMMSGGK